MERADQSHHEVTKARSKEQNYSPAFFVPSRLGGENRPPGQLGFGDLRKALESLSPDQRDVLLLRECERFSYDQIAQALGLTYGQVVARLFEARREMLANLRMNGVASATLDA